MAVTVKSSSGSSTCVDFDENATLDHVAHRGGVSPRLVAVGGLSGVGKSSLAGALAPEIGRAPGALWLRSDVERKAMFGIDWTARLHAAAYDADVTRDVYKRLIDKARIALRAGQSVLVDATFAAAAERGAAAAVAAEVGVAFAGLFLDAPLATRLERIGSRRADASDVDADVARRQTAEPLGERGMGGGSGFGEFKRHGGPGAGASQRRLKRWSDKKRAPASVTGVNSTWNMLSDWIIVTHCKMVVRTHAAGAVARRRRLVINVNASRWASRPPALRELTDSHGLLLAKISRIFSARSAAVYGFFSQAPAPRRATAGSA